MLSCLGPYVIEAPFLVVVVYECWRGQTLKMYVRKLKCTIVLISTFAVCYIYYFLNEQSWSWYLHSAEKNIRCQTPIEEMRDLIQLTRDTHIILDSYNLTHFPIYGRLVYFYIYCIVYCLFFLRGKQFLCPYISRVL